MQLLVQEQWATNMLQEDRPDVQIFMALLESNMWRPTDSGRKVVLEWLHSVARTTLSSSASASVQERRDAFRIALASEDTDSAHHPSKVGGMQALNCIKAA